MNVLVVGRGGREHSIVKKITESKKVSHIYVAPGNGGMEKEATCIAIDETDIDALITFAKAKQIDLTIVGPETPLLLGITNRFVAENLPIFAPTKEAALLEGSKSFAKAFMERHGIATADHETFTDATAAKQYVKEKGVPIVIKADGLAAGKGVVVATTETEAFTAIEAMLVQGKFSAAGQTIVIEEFLAGKEFSLMSFVHGNNVYPMVPARDHKRAFDGDTGPNTGGMGAYAPVPDLSISDLEFSVKNILQRAADGLVKENRPFTGILYAGLIMTERGPKVIEFNTRFGDPETQVVLPLLKNDLVDVFIKVLAGVNPDLDWKPNYCSGVVLAAEGYPESYQTGKELPKLEVSGNTFTIHAGTKLAGEDCVSNGGRVLLVGATGSSLEEAAKSIYHVLPPVDQMNEYFYRRDIGMQQIGNYTK